MHQKRNRLLVAHFRHVSQTLSFYHAQCKVQEGTVPVVDSLTRPMERKRKKSRVRHAFMKTGGKALHSPFVALNGHGAKLRNHDESFGFDKSGKWVHESAKDRVAYLKVTKRPPTYFSKTGALSLFYLDGRDADGNPIKDISKTQTHVHGTKFTDKMMEKG